MLCYSFISHCCPLVLIMVGSFKLEIGMLQKQRCPFWFFAIVSVGTLCTGAWEQGGIYVCVCVCMREIFLSVCLAVPPSVYLHVYTHFCN